MRQIRKANPDIFKGKVIEVGAGTGIVSSTLSNFSEIEQMHCLDYDEHTVENLMPLVQYSLGADTAKMTRIVGSYNNMEAADASYDTVVAVGAVIFAIFHVTRLLEKLSQDWVENALMRGAGVVTILFAGYSLLKHLS